VEPDTLKEELRALLNRHSRENASNTPDFILAEFMLTSLAAFEHASREREKWYGRSLPTPEALSGSWPFVDNDKSLPRAGQYYVWDGEKPVWRDPDAIKVLRELRPGEVLVVPTKETA
jgi:hypothetical protein